MKLEIKMPYALDIPKHLPGCLNWSDTSQTPENSSKATSLSRTGGETQPPIPFIQAQYEEDLRLFPVSTKLPDIFQGRWSASFFVSDRFRKIVSELDPVEHLFQPVDLTMIDGTRYHSGYYALGIADRVEAIDAENSDLRAKFYDGKTFQSLKTKGVEDVLSEGRSLGQFTYFAAALGEPFIQWRKEDIAGRHLWMDRYYTSEAFISDEMAKAFKKEGITGLELRPSAITGATGPSSGGFLQQLGSRLRRTRNRRYDELDKHNES
ncbi:imm11 family protein [Tateyamaria sp. SN3-11]|uniref:imm11 family protein n=1 Tax=Tateyamaria sp. SN3-11 TaxID=3092147 RepID=UPI0039ED817C